jgi:hypothetical protein
MSLHLDAIGRKVAPGAHAVLVSDGAGYHSADALAVPDNVTLLRLPLTVFDDYDDIVDKTCEAWNFFANDPDRIRSITTRPWATVNR